MDKVRRHRIPYHQYLAADNNSLTMIRSVPNLNRPRHKERVSLLAMATMQIVAKGIKQTAIVTHWRWTTAASVRKTVAADITASRTWALGDPKCTKVGVLVVMPSSFRWCMSFRKKIRTRRSRQKRRRRRGNSRTSGRRPRKLKERRNGWKMAQIPRKIKIHLKLFQSRVAKRRMKISILWRGRSKAIRRCSTKGW